jgi:hypothetical protein
MLCPCAPRKGSVVLILLETGESDDCNLARGNGTIDRVMNSAPTGTRRASVSGLSGLGPNRKAGQC